MLIVELKIPIYIILYQKGKQKRFSLNLNVYRNSHFKILNDAKVEYARIINNLLEGIPELKQISLHYELFLNTNRRTDTNNVLSIVDKFFSDCLVSTGIIKDDDYKNVIATEFRFGGIDKESDGYAIVTIKEIDN